jgi:Domain of unknown function (DUF6438)
VLVAIVCMSSRGHAQSPRVAIGLDSVVLVRTTCFGTCPAYRLSLGSTGEASLEPRGPIDKGPTRRGSVAAESLLVIRDLARLIGFAEFPDSIAKSPRLCPNRATDHETVIVTLFTRRVQKQVVDYHGCFAASDHSTAPGIGKLRMFEARIEAIGQAATRPRRADDPQMQNAQDATDGLALALARPPESAKPRTWWRCALFKYEVAPTIIAITYVSSNELTYAT